MSCELGCELAPGESWGELDTQDCSDAVGELDSGELGQWENEDL